MCIRDRLITLPAAGIATEAAPAAAPTDVYKRQLTAKDTVKQFEFV